VHFALSHIYSGTNNIPDSISIVELATLTDMLGLEGLKEVIMYTLKVKYCHFFHKVIILPNLLQFSKHFYI
jgi:BTB/POZ domain-containing protein 8